MPTAPMKPDPWAQYAPLSPDPRLLFVVHTGLVSSPLPTPLSPHSLPSSLKSAERHYLNSCVQIDVAGKEVCPPTCMYMGSSE